MHASHTSGLVELVEQLSSFNFKKRFKIFVETPPKNISSMYNKYNPVNCLFIFITMALLQSTKDDISKAISHWIEVEEAKEEQYPCDFDLIWKWAGYSNKSHAKRKLLSCLVEGTDYVQTIAVPIGSTFKTIADPNGGGPSRGGQNKISIYLSVDAAKGFLLQTPTPIGRAVRLFFIQAEKECRHLKRQRELLVNKVVSGEIEVIHKPSQTKWQPDASYAPLEDGVYLQTRFDACVANIQKNKYIVARFPNLGANFYVLLNGTISETVLGKRPRQFLKDNKLIEKREVKKRKREDEEVSRVVMAYPPNPTSRSVMISAQLGAIMGIEAVVQGLAETCQTVEDFKEQVFATLASMKQNFRVLHGKYVASFVELEDVKEKRRSNMLENKSTNH